MKPYRSEAFLTALVVIPVAFALWGTNLKMAFVALAFFGTCVTIFFLPSISDHIRDRRYTARD